MRKGIALSLVAIALALTSRVAMSEPAPAPPSPSVTAPAPSAPVPAPSVNPPPDGPVPAPATDPQAPTAPPTTNPPVPQPPPFQQNAPNGGQVQPGYSEPFPPGPPRYPAYAQPGAGPPPPPPPKKSTCCRFAIRFDPFDLLFRRLSFQAEVAIIGPLAIEVEPSWIWGSGADNVDAHGVAIAGNVAFYLTGRAPQGFFIKATAAYENFRAVVTNPDLKKSQGSARIHSPIFGGMIGSSTVFGKNWGFNISGGIGIGAATAGSQQITAPGNAHVPAYVVRFYDKGSVIQLLGDLGLGIAF